MRSWNNQGCLNNNRVCCFLAVRISTYPANLNIVSDPFRHLHTDFDHFGEATDLGVSRQDHHKQERPKPTWPQLKRQQTWRVTDRNGHKPKKPRTKTTTDRKGHRPERPQTEMATNRNRYKKEWSLYIYIYYLEPFAFLSCLYQFLKIMAYWLSFRMIVISF